MPINSIPASGNPVTPRNLLRALKAPLAAIPDDTTGGVTSDTLNQVLATLRQLGFIAP